MNESLRKIIKKHEGLSLIPYKCPAGFKTVGWGWNFDSNPLPEDVSEYMHDHGKITAEMAERLLDISIERAVKDCHRLFKDFDKYSDNRRDALTDMMFQMGYGTFSKFTTTLRMIRDEHWGNAADNLLLSKWARKDTPKRAREVIELLRKG